MALGTGCTVNMPEGAPTRPGWLHQRCTRVHGRSAADAGNGATDGADQRELAPRDDRRPSVAVCVLRRRSRIVRTAQALSSRLAAVLAAVTAKRLRSSTVCFSGRENPRGSHVAAALGEQAGPRGGIEAFYLTGIDFAQRS